MAGHSTRYCVVWVCGAILAQIFAAQGSWAAPVAGELFRLPQLDGSWVEVRIWGDEFYGVTESLDGYTLVRDSKTHFLCYAVLTADGNDLQSAGVPVGAPMPAALGLVPHLRIHPSAARAKARAARARWENEGRAIVGSRGTREGPFTGNVQGICLIVDFSDDVGTIASSTVSNYCNQVGFTGFSNNGSVRDYFFDVSDGALTYTNFVPTAYYRAAHPKTYYTDPNIEYGARARELIVEALTNLDNNGFDFSQYDANADGVIDALNCFYAGAVSNDWAEGLWPHAGWVSFCADGVCTERYQITNMGSALRLRTFCHENGHMLLGWPDLYDYDYDSRGVGRFCLMAYSTTDTNPCEPCAYLKHVAGWSQTTLLTVPQTGLPVSAASANRCYKFDRPGHPNEYYLAENRQQVGRDAELPDGGLAIWHIDTLGDNSNNEMTPESHYLVTLVQADGHWDLEHDANQGDSTDLWAAPAYINCTPATIPNTNWWNGSGSGLAITNISASASVMTFDFSANSLGGPILTWGPGVSDATAVQANFVAVAGGVYFSLGLKTDGSIVAWGDNQLGQCNVPAPNSGFIAVAAGRHHGLGLKADGSIVAWGHNGYGQCNVPAPNSGFVAVAGGGFHSLGLKADGSIVAWGAGACGQSGLPHFGQSCVPAPNSGFVAVAGGGYHSLGLRADGSIVAWGAGACGQSGSPHYGQSCVPAPNSGFVAVSAGRFHNLGLKADGSIVAWGLNEDGQCNVPAPNGGFVAVAASGSYYRGCSLGLRADGSIVAWGSNQYGQCNVPAPNSGFVAVAMSEEYSLGLRTNGSIVAWGIPYSGQCHVPAPDTDFTAIAGGEYHSLGLKADGSIVAWGDNQLGQCNVPAPNSGFVAVAAGLVHSLGLKADSSVVAWGYNGYGQCDPVPNSGFVGVAGGTYHSLGLKADGSIVAWGAGACGQSGSPHYGQSCVPAPNSGFIAVAAGSSHSLGLKADGSIVTWGYNGYGQCNVPAPNSGFVAVAAGYNHSLGLKADGSIVAWGAGACGQSGSPHYGQSCVPAPNRGFVAVAGGGFHSLGLKADGSIIAWGLDDYGQCNVPASNSGFVAIAGGGYHSLGLKAIAGPIPPDCADLDGDDVIDTDDFYLFAACMSGPDAPNGGCAPAVFDLGDIDNDGDIDLADFAQFQPSFGQPCP